MKIRQGFISNSSTSCFILNSGWRDKENNPFSFKEIKSVLKKIIDFYNDIYKTELVFEKVFQNPTKIDKKFFKILYIYIYEEKGALIIDKKILKILNEKRDELKKMVLSNLIIRTIITYVTLFMVQQLRALGICWI